MKCVHVLTNIGILLSLSIFSLFIFILMFSYSETDARYVSGIIIVIILYFDLFYRVRTVMGRHYYGNRQWNKQARMYAAFGTLYLLLPLAWTYSDRIFEYYGKTSIPLQSFYGADKQIIMGTIVYNLIVGFF